MPAAAATPPGSSLRSRASIARNAPTPPMAAAPWWVDLGYENAPMGVVESTLTALQKGDVESCFDFSSTELRKATGPRPRFESLLRTMPEYRALIENKNHTILSSLQVGPNRWRYRVRVDNALGSIPFSVAYTWEVTQQPEEGVIKYDLGQCLTHRKFGYKGVIIGWDTKCRQPEEWCKAMEIDTLSRGRKQPFYHVLVHEHDMVTYVAEELVEPTAPTTIDHPRFEEHFVQFTGPSGFAPMEDKETGTWKPNKNLRSTYPLDHAGTWLVNRVFPDKDKILDA